MQDIIEDNPIDVQKSILHHGEGVDLLPSNIELLEVRLINAISREMCAIVGYRQLLKPCVNEVKKSYGLLFNRLYAEPWYAHHQRTGGG